MKKLLFGMMAVAAMAVASCERSFDGAYYAGGGSAMVSVEVGMPDGVTRAFSDGETATQLQYAVYEVNGGTLKLIDENGNSAPGDPYQGNKELVNRATKLSFTLLTNHTYGIVFWAAAQNAPYTVTFDEAGATMTYTDGATLTANDDELDAFWAYKKVDIKGDGSVSVTLKRPFAQINVGTSDYAKAKALGLEVAVSSISVKNAYTTLDLVSGEATVEQEMAFNTANIPSGETYPVTGYDYLAMAYVLVGTEQEVAEVTFGYGADAATATTRTVGSVPLVRNHRTNIYGALLTSQLDVNVEVDGDTEGDENVMLTWDGTTKKEPARDEETGAYIVNGADELAWLASQEDEDYEGETIILQNDLDLAGKEFPAFAAGATRDGSKTDGTSFKGVFDGNGKTISNVKITNSSTAKGTIAGIFASVAGEESAVRNVTFENVEITGGEQAGVVGIVSDGATVEGVVVKGNVSSQSAAGGVVGRVLMSGTVKDCENHATVESKTANAGGIIGAAYYTEDGSSMTITGCDNYGNVSGTSNSIGGIVGLCCGDVSDCENHGTVTGSASSVGGIVGEQKAAGSVKGCTNYADVKGGTASNHLGAGGIVGWVRYAPSGEFGSYPYEEQIVVSGNTNEGKHISGVTGVGGIVGTWYHDGLCTENTNLAETISASDRFAAGIVGDSQWGELGSDKKGVNETELKLSVTKNVTYTNIDNITGSLTNEFIYINNAQRTEQSGNTNPTVTTVSSQEALAAAVSNKEEGAYIKVGAGEYTLPSGVANGVTIDGSGEATFKITQSSGNLPAGLGQNITFKNTKFSYVQNSQYSGYQNATLTYVNCEFEGQVFSYSSNCTYKDCKFTNSGNNYCMWTYASTPITFENCEFYSDGKALLLYREESSVVHEATIKNCKFYATTAVDGKAAIEISSEKAPYKVVIEGCTEEGFGLGDKSENSLWNVKNNANPVTVTVDGEEVVNKQ